MKKKNFILIFFLSITIIVTSAFSVSLIASEKESSDEFILINDEKVKSEYLRDLKERTADLGESIIKDLDGTKFRLQTILLRAEKYPTQVIYLESIKETSLKEKENIKDKIHNIVNSKDFSAKETFKINFKESKDTKTN